MEDKPSPYDQFKRTSTGNPGKAGCLLAGVRCSYTSFIEAVGPPGACGEEMPLITGFRTGNIPSCRGAPSERQARPRARATASALPRRHDCGVSFTGRPRCGTPVAKTTTKKPPSKRPLRSSPRTGDKRARRAGKCCAGMKLWSKYSRRVTSSLRPPAGGGGPAAAGAAGAAPAARRGFRSAALSAGGQMSPREGRFHLGRADFTSEGQQAAAV